MADALLQAFRIHSEYANSLTNGMTNFSLNQTTDTLEYIFQSQADLTITRLFTRLGAITGTTPTYRISLQGVDATGIPDGTIKGATNNALATFSPSGLGWAAGSGNWLTLGESYTSVRGEMLAIVIDYSSGSVDASNFASFTQAFTGGGASRQLPYSISNNAGSRTRMINNNPLYGYGTAGGKYGWPLKTTSTVTLSNSSNPREAGFVFTIPASWPSCQLLGVEIPISNFTGGNTFTVRLYNGGGASDTTVLQDITMDTDHQGVATGGGILRVYFNETTLATLTAGSSYRVAMESLSTPTFRIQLWDQESGDDWDAWPFGSAMQYTTRPSAGSWTDVDTTRFMVSDLILADVTAGSAGGMLVHGGMTGGFRG